MSCIAALEQTTVQSIIDVGSAFMRPALATGTTLRARSSYEEMRQDWRREGFMGIEELDDFAKQTGLGRYAKAARLWAHEFELVRMLPPEPKVTLQ